MRPEWSEISAIVGSDQGRKGLVSVYWVDDQSVLHHVTRHDMTRVSGACHDPAPGTSALAWGTLGVKIVFVTRERCHHHPSKMANTENRTRDLFSFFYQGWMGGVSKARAWERPTGQRGVKKQLDWLSCTNMQTDPVHLKV